MLGRSVVFGVVVVLAVLACSARANQLIFLDYTSGVTFMLPPGLSNPNQQDSTYSTFNAGSVMIGLNWNGDLADQFAIALPTGTPLTLTPTNDLPDCSLALLPGGVTLNASNPHCNYTLSWTSSFFGVLTITYNTANSYQPGESSAESISISFTNTAVVGDPQFVGLRGQSYQVHGIDGAVYNIISDTDTQVNARFVFLTQGQCPVFNGVPDTNCWSHPGSYLGEMSFQQVVDGKLHAALLMAGSAKQGFAGVQMDGRAVRVGQTVSFGSFSLSVQDSYTVHITTSHFEFQLSNSDMFINQALRATVPLSQLKAHGLLGQTHSTTTYATPLKYVDGSVDDYVISDGDIFGSDFVYNQFQQ